MHQFEIVELSLELCNACIVRIDYVTIQFDNFAVRVHLLSDGEHHRDAKKNEGKNEGVYKSKSQSILPLSTSNELKYFVFLAVLYHHLR